MSNTKNQRIRVSLSLTKAADAAVLARGQSVVSGMTSNPAFTNPPVDLASLKTGLESYSIAIGDAVDGGKKAIVERRRQRDGVITMLRALAHYVESACNNEISTLLSSGFEPLLITRTPPQRLPPASIRRIDQGNTGELLVKVNSV